MAKLLRVVPLLPALCVLGACAPHYSDVRPTASGPHTVVIPIKSKGDGFAYAMGQARFYCQEVHKKSAVVVKEDTKYVGSMDEKTYNTAKTLTEVTAAAGFLGGWFCTKQEERRQQPHGGLGWLDRLRCDWRRISIHVGIQLPVSPGGILIRRAWG